MKISPNLKLLSVLSVLSIAAPAWAEDVSCYGREYSEQHLKEHPNQQVKKLRLKIQKSPSEYDRDLYFLDIEASIKGEEHNFQNFRAFMACQEEGRSGVYKCGIDCDGGNAEYYFRNNGDKLVFENKGFVLQGGCGDEAEHFVWLNNVRGGDDTFWTYKLRPEFCQARDF